MAFTSPDFLIFVSVVYLICVILQKLFSNKGFHSKTYIFILSFFSYIYIGLADIRFVPCLAGLTFFVFVCGRLIEKYPEKKYICRIGVGICIVQLAAFKYLGMLGGVIDVSRIIVPLGVSFYTFSCISYLLDIYRKRYDAWNSIIEFAAYISFFPKLMSGPIVRPDKFKKYSGLMNPMTLKRFLEGIQIIVLGLFKKMVVADHLALFVDDVYWAPSAFSSGTVWLATVAYSLQIYFDFSGYSDIAIGVAKLFGFDFDKNFDIPYVSSNPTEFWKRWHISLSVWLQDYLYISLGGNRKGKVRTFLNLLITMIIGGLWHGANLTFVLWGTLNGIVLVFHKLFMQWKVNRFGNKQAGGTIWKICATMMTLLFTNICWIFFRSDSLQKACMIMSKMFSFSDGIHQPFSWAFFALVIAIVEIVVAIIRRTKNNGIHQEYISLNLGSVWQLALFFVFVGITVMMAYVGETAFIYGAF